MQSEFGVGMKNAEELRLNRGGWQVCTCRTNSKDNSKHLYFLTILRC